MGLWQKDWEGGAVGMTQAYNGKGRKDASDRAAAFRIDSPEQQHICHFLSSLCLLSTLAYDILSPSLAPLLTPLWTMQPRAG